MTERVKAVGNRKRGTEEEGRKRRWRLAGRGGETLAAIGGVIYNGGFCVKV